MVTERMDGLPAQDSANQQTPRQSRAFGSKSTARQSSSTAHSSQLTRCSNAKAPNTSTPQLEHSRPTETAGVIRDSNLLGVLSIPSNHGGLSTTIAIQNSPQGPLSRDRHLAYYQGLFHAQQNLQQAQNAWLCYATKPEGHFNSTPPFAGGYHTMGYGQNIGESIVRDTLRSV